MGKLHELPWQAKLRENPVSEVICRYRDVDLEAIVEVTNAASATHGLDLGTSLTRFLYEKVGFQELW